MILYHGTNTDIDTIDLAKGMRHKDFGKGQPTHNQIATYLTDYALSEMVKYEMEDAGCSVEQALERIYNSPLMSALQDEEGELYVQSPAYLYELMNAMEGETAIHPA